MMNASTIKPYALPIIAGYLFYIVQMILWGFMLKMENPFYQDWLMSVFLPDNRIMFYVVTYVRDVLINLFIAIPFALAFLKLNFRQKLIALSITVVPCFLYEYRYFFLNYQGLSHLIPNNAGTYYGFALSLLVLPFSVWLTSKITSGGALGEL